MKLLSFRLYITARWIAYVFAMAVWVAAVYSPITLSELKRGEPGAWLIMFLAWVPTIALILGRQWIRWLLAPAEVEVIDRRLSL